MGVVLRELVLQPDFMPLVVGVARVGVVSDSRAGRSFASGLHLPALGVRLHSSTSLIDFTPRLSSSTSLLDFTP